MVNYRLVLALLLVVLVFFSGFMFISNNAKKADLREAEQLAGSVYRYFREVDYICRTSPDDFEKLNECVRDLSEQLDSVDDLEEEDFQEFDEDTNETGHIIILNDGRSSFESEQFVLLKNREVTDKGCDIPGTIDEGYVCKLHFNSTCGSGDVLEVQYNGTRALVKTC